MNKPAKKLRLRECPSTSDATERIYAITHESCERFNAYYLDFVESVQILAEKREETATPGAREEIEERISWMHMKIEDLTSFMHDIARQMPDFVDVVDE